MHMADALLSPAIGGGMWAVGAIIIGVAAKKTTALIPDARARNPDTIDDFGDKKIPLMSVLGAFVFAGQMLNFAIPGTGSSGHIGGGILLTALLGPAAATLVIAAVLLIQCLFFADGGLLAYGANVFNIVICAGVLAYYAVYRPLLKNHFNSRRLAIAAFFAAIVGLQIGAMAVCLETYFSGVTALPFRAFVLVMQPIHLAIGIVEGALTAMVLQYVYRMRPELLRRQPFTSAEATVAKLTRSPKAAPRRLLWTFAIAAVIIGGGLSWLASENPDGLEWSIAQVAGATELPNPAVAEQAAAIVERTALMPDYNFATHATKFGGAAAGIFGGAAVALILGAVGFVLRGRLKPTAASDGNPANEKSEN